MLRSRASIADGAVAPPAPLATEKQRRLCLTPDYPSCPTFEAARAARPVAHDRAPTLPRPLANTTPVVLDHGRITITLPALGSDRSTGQAALIALMAVAFAAIVLARLTGGGARHALPISATPHARREWRPCGLGDVDPSPAGSIGTGFCGAQHGRRQLDRVGQPASDDGAVDARPTRSRRGTRWLASRPSTRRRRRPSPGSTTSRTHRTSCRPGAQDPLTRAVVQC